MMKLMNAASAKISARPSSPARASAWLGVLSIAVLAAAACHPGPVLTPKLAVGGTIAGIVSTDGNAAVPGRRVSAIDVASGQRHEATTGVNGGYTIKVPEGVYRLEVELLPGEVVIKQPDETRVQKSDLDPKRNFTIGVKARRLRAPSDRAEQAAAQERTSGKSDAFEPWFRSVVSVIAAARAA